MPANPFRAIDDRPVMHPYAARRYAKSIGHEVPLREAVGKVAAEVVEVYPPGHPADPRGLPRLRRTPSTTCCEARDEGGSIVARDTSCDAARPLAAAAACVASRCGDDPRCTTRSAARTRARRVRVRVEPTARSR